MRPWKSRAIDASRVVLFGSRESPFFSRQSKIKVTERSSIHRLPSGELSQQTLLTDKFIDDLVVV
ncbi:MAG TPA: hypothetical protein VLL54_22230 [Pyrinomonadaceae bacterium]|nr:hypothetical protein [Pyrinomonadaceae bacterium]